MKRNRPKIIILADDLSSASDCSVQMIADGHRGIVPLTSGYNIPDDVDIAAYETNSRNLSPEAAAAATAHCISRLTKQSDAIVYKSVDSTLRGNLGAEISVILDRGDFHGAIIAPAFPTYGRTTRDGQQYLRLVPLHKTEFATDPTTPVTTPVIADLIATQCSRKTAIVSLQVLEQGREAVDALLRNQLALGTELFIFDAIEEADLGAIANICGSLPYKMLWVGSTGLSRYIPKAIGLQPRQQRSPVLASEGTVLVVAGSASQTMRRQLDVCDLVEVRVNSLPVARGGSEAQDEFARARTALENADISRTLALTVTSTRDDIARTREAGRAQGLSPEDVSASIVDMLGRLTVAFVRGGAAVKGLILSGGDTAMTICKQLQSEAIEILDEIEPGVPLGWLTGIDDMLVVTKAGGFGNELSLITSVQRIREYGQD